MCKQASYSKYQKRAIKFLSDYLGSDTPFSYERTQTNHLKVLIEGVESPLFTGSTPSDCKSINNFMAEVKRAVRASKQNDEQVESRVPDKFLNNKVVMTQDRLIQNCVKSLRARLDTMKSKEEAQVLATKSLDEIITYRTNSIKYALSLALHARKQGVYIKPKEMKEIECKIAQHLNFMLPTRAYYAELLDSKNKYKAKHVVANQEESLTNNVIKLEGTTKLKSITEQVSVENQPQPEVNMNNNKSQHQDGSASELMAMSSNNRIALLRNLSKAQSLQLIDDINQALAMNREQDITEVVNMIKQKDLPLEAIISRLEVA